MVKFCYLVNRNLIEIVIRFIKYGEILLFYVVSYVIQGKKDNLYN